MMRRTKYTKYSRNHIFLVGIYASALFIFLTSFLYSAGSVEYLKKYVPIELKFSPKDSDFDRKKLIPILKSEDLSDKGIVRKDGKIIPLFLENYIPPTQFIAPYKQEEKSVEGNTTEESVHNKVNLDEDIKDGEQNIESLPIIIERNFKKTKTNVNVLFNAPFNLDSKNDGYNNQSSASYSKK